MDGFGVVLLRTPIVRIQVVVTVGIAELSFDFSLPSREGVGDVFEEDQAEDGVLVNGGAEVGAETVGGGPQFFEVS